MRMHVRAKMIAIAGLLAAFSAVLLVLSSMIESNSLIFIGLASFCVGIMIREWGMRAGMIFWIASVLVNLIVAPNKFYGLTYAGMGVYLLLSEMLWESLAKKPNMKNRTVMLWIGKYVFFNLMYIPVLLLVPQLIFTKKMTGKMWVVFLIAGQLILWAYDWAYRRFQGHIWTRLRVKMMNIK